MAQRSRFFDSQGVNITLANPSAAADDIIDTTTPHGFVAGQPVHFTALTGGAGLTVGTIYWVTSTSLGAQTFRVAATPGGADINFTTDITAGTVVGGDRVYDSAALAQVMAGTRTDGVAKFDNELAVSEQSPAAMGVRVNTGKAFILGYFFEVHTAQEPLTIAAAHATLNRIDRVVVRRDLTGRQAVLAVLTGTPASSPSAPALTQNVSGTYEIPLAQVFVGAAVASILNGNITDERGTRSHDPYIDSALTGALAPASLSTPVAVLSGSLKLNGITTPATISSNQNDYNPAGLSGSNVLRIQTTAGQSISGIQAPSSGSQLLLLVNIGNSSFTLLHDSASSAAANRILCHGDTNFSMTINNNAVILWYDTVSQRWRMLAGRDNG